MSWPVEMKGLIVSVPKLAVPVITAVNNRSAVINNQYIFIIGQNNRLTSFYWTQETKQYDEVPNWK